MQYDEFSINYMGSFLFIKLVFQIYTNTRAKMEFISIEMKTEKTLIDDRSNVLMKYVHLVYLKNGRFHLILSFI